MTQRSIIKAQGKDIQSFLQGLVTQDMKALDNKPCYSLLLDSKGRYYFDFFIIKQADNFLIDIDEARALELIEVLNYYRLLNQVDFQVMKEYSVYYSLQPLEEIVSEDRIIFQDPRHKDMGYRVITKEPPSINLLTDVEYKVMAYKIGVMLDGFTIHKSIPAELGFFELNAISFNKGCYLGQEFTNSCKHKLAIRKRAIPFQLDKEVFKKDNLTNNQQEKVGEVLDFCNGFGIALLKMKYINQDIFINDQQIIINKPNWLLYYSLD